MHTLKIGSILALLWATTLQAASAPGAYTVRPGDSLWAIAARSDVYGDPWKWPLLKDANPVLIADPDLIQPGWRLKVPLAPSAAAVAEARRFAQRYKEPLVEPLVVGAEPSVAAAVGAREAPPPAKAGSADPGYRLGLGTGLSLAALAILMGAALIALFRRAQREQLAAEAVEPQPAPEPAPQLSQPTESEAILRAEAGPDPLHPEDHKEAA